MRILDEDGEPVRFWNIAAGLALMIASAFLVTIALWLIAAAILGAYPYHGGVTP